MVTLDSSFEDDLRETVLDDVESKLVGQQDNLIHRTVQESHDVLEAYGSRHGYDVQPVIDSLQTPEITRTDRSVSVHYGWAHPAAPYFALGTSEHTIQGNPVLSFVWSREDAPGWVADEFEAEGDGYRVFLPEVTVSGLPESRFVRAGLEWLRQEVT